MTGNFYRKLAKRLPKFITNDLFFSKEHFVENSLSFYAPAWNRNRERRFSDKIFLEIHRVLKALSLLNNFVDRKIARLQVALLVRKYTKDKIISRNKIFSNKHKGQRCFVIGNGPSLSKQDLTPLANETTFVVNGFSLHPILQTGWQPTYYCRVHFDNFYGADGKLVGPDNSQIKTFLEYFQQVQKRMPKTTYFLPLYMRDANKEYHFLPEDKTYYLPVLPYATFEFLPGYPDIGRGLLPWAPDVSQYAIMMAMSMGFKEIILLGCDHTDYMIREETRHFYEGSESVFRDDFNSAFKPILDMNLFNLMVWRGHESLKKTANERGVEIINATGGGILDVYPLGCYENIIAEKPEAKL
jgi:hypothetical protein